MLDFKKTKNFLPNTTDKPVFVISAIRIHFGGALEVVNDLLLFLNKNATGDYRIIVLVCNKNLYLNLSNIEFIEFPASRKSVFYRIWMEYFGFTKLSEKWEPAIWLSMQDSTPRVKSEKKFTYWHSPLLQRGLRFSDLKKDHRLFFLTLLYKFLYSKNAHTNTAVFVQQHSMKDILMKQLDLPEEKILVAPLTVRKRISVVEEKRSKYVFVYPSYPYLYKNFQQLIDAAKSAEMHVSNFEVWLTSNGHENKYVNRLYKKTKSSRSIKWLGYQSIYEIKKTYACSDALIYVSENETWGIPISIFKEMKKPIITVDLPYAHETVGEYDKVKFVQLHNVISLKNAIVNAVQNQLIFDQTSKINNNVLFDWKEVFEAMVGNKVSKKNKEMTFAYNGANVKEDEQICGLNK